MQARKGHQVWSVSEDVEVICDNSGELQTIFIEG